MEIVKKRCEKIKPGNYYLLVIVYRFTDSFGNSKKNTAIFIEYRQTLRFRF